MPEEEEFKIVDKRRMMSDEEEEVSEAQIVEKKETEPVAEQTQGIGGEQKVEKEGKEEASSSKAATGPEVLMAVRLAMKIFVENAYLLMGLVRHPETKQIVLDLSQARIAIDCYKALYETTEKHFNELEKKELRALLSDLQINFASQAKKGAIDIK